MDAQPGCSVVLLGGLVCIFKVTIAEMSVGVACTLQFHENSRSDIFVYRMDLCNPLLIALTELY